MTNQISTPAIGESELELLEAAGFADTESLAKAGVDELAEELQRANSILKIVEEAPSRSTVKQWILEAREQMGKGSLGNAPVVRPVDHENSPDVAVMLAEAPFAIPLPAKFLVDQQLSVADIPPAILLNRYPGDLDVRVDERMTVPKATRHATVTSNIRIADGPATRLDIDAAKVKPVDVLAGAKPRTATSKSPGDDDRVALIRSPRVETNRGKDPSSRRYIRGVLHSHPFSLVIGAISTLTLCVMLPVGIFSAALLLFSSEMPEKFGWVPKWLLAFPVALPILGLSYLIWGARGSCRICGQKLFLPRMCLKNTKAHYVRGLGHIIPLCFHLLLFRWFRCTYCGTPVRLKK